VGEDRHRLLRAEHRHRHDRHPRSHRGADEAAAAEAAQAVALPVELARRLLALGEHEHQPPLVAQQALRVRRVGGYQPHLADQHAHARVPLEPVLAEHVDRARARVLVPDRLHDHRRVGRQGARVIRHEQGAVIGGDVLDALDLDPEPVPVVEVEHRLDGVEHALRAPPVVQLAARLGGRHELAQLGQVDLLLRLGRLGLGREGAS
jgi:hypothetical protein